MRMQETEMKRVNERYDVVIVGAGLTGIMAAKTLRAKGVNHLLMLEKETVAGGRVATRRLGQSSWDIGAQFFTVRSPLLQSWANEWLRRGWIEKWFGERHSRYASPGGMDRLVHFLCKPLPIRYRTEVDRVEPSEQGWRCQLRGGHAIASRALLLTPPAPVSLRLLEKGNVPLDDRLRATLSSIRFQPSFVGLFELNQPSRLVADRGHLARNLPPEIERVADQQRKGVSATPAVTVYMTGDWSERHWRQADDEIIRQIRRIISPFIPSSHIQASHVIRWERAQTIRPIRSPFIDAGSSERPLLIAGDAFFACR